jgi:hypothetical protein
MHRLVKRHMAFDYAYDMTCPSRPDSTFSTDEDYDL